MKRTFWIIILILLFIGIGIGLWLWLKPATENILNPQISGTTLTITDINENRVNLTARVVLNNPLPLEVTTRNLLYNLYIDSSLILSGSYEKPITIRSSDSSVISIPVEVELKRLEHVLKRFAELNIDSAMYRVDAAFVFAKPIAGMDDLKIHFQRRMPTIRIPKVLSVETDLRKLGLKESSLDIVVVIQNPNRFYIEMTRDTVRVTVDNSLHLIGIIPGRISLAAYSTDTIPVHLDIHTPRLGKLVWKGLFEKKQTQVAVDFKCIIESEQKLLDNANVNLHVKGNLDELLKLAK